MASPVVAGTAESSTPTAGTSHVLNWTGLGTVAAGDLLLIILDKGSTSATVNAHADWTELLDEAVANGLYIAYRWATGGETAPTLVTSANTRSAEITYRITGAENPATTAPQIGTTSSGSSATPDPPASATPPSSKDYLFIAFYGAAGEEADDDTWSDTSPTNYTPSPPRMKACGVAGTNLGGMIAAAERALTTGVAQNPGTFAKDVSVAWRAQTITVHPSTSNPVTVTPGTVALVLATFAAVVTATANVTVTPGTASLSLASFAPTVSTPRLVTPATAALSLSTFAPTIGIGVVATPSTASLTTAAFAPTVSTTNNQLVVPSTAALTTITFAPTVTASDNKTVTPGTASLATVTFSPTVTRSTGTGFARRVIGVAKVSDIKLGDTMDMKFTTVNTAGLASTLTGGVVAAYPGNSVTEITAGITLTADLDSRVGLNNIRVVATSANGYAAATSYALVLTAGTVDSISVAGYVIGHFTVEGATLAEVLTARDLLKRKRVLNPATGLFTIYDEDGVTPLFTAQTYKDAAGTQPYDGTGRVHRTEELM